uniref:U6 snRNA-associated Sm-like protein LSm2 n=1 Tax=Steinernema glaseri TaxID=37863 RepID=A0A1I7YMZ9_9BILA
CSKTERTQNIDIKPRCVKPRVKGSGGWAFPPHSEVSDLISSVDFLLVVQERRLPAWIENAHLTCVITPKARSSPDLPRRITSPSRIKCLHPRGLALNHPSSLAPDSHLISSLGNGRFRRRCWTEKPGDRTRRLDEHQGDILEVLPHCSSFQPRLESEENVMNVECCNGMFYVWTAEDVQILRTRYRTWVEANGVKIEESLPCALMPEQAQVLLEHGLVRIRRLRNCLPSQESASERQVVVRKKASITDEEAIKIAHAMVKGRKAKALKRKANGEFANAAANRVRATDTQGIEVDEEELAAAVAEVKERKLKGATEKVGYNLPAFRVDDESYDILESPPFPTSEEYRLRLVVYRDLWRKGFYLTEGFKFGCSYLAYEGIPGEDHSHYMVRCIASEDSISPHSVISLSRVASQVRKSIILAIVSYDSLSPYYLKVDWWRVVIKMLFFSFFKSLVGKEVVVELKNDLSICGTLHSVDQYLNMKLTDISVLDADRYPHMYSVKNCFIRGSVVRYVQLPADQVDTQLLQEATRKELQSNKTR